MKNNALKPKDESPAKSMALGNDDDEDGGERSQAYYITKAAQKHGELQKNKAKVHYAEARVRKAPRDKEPSCGAAGAATRAYAASRSRCSQSDCRQRCAPAERAVQPATAAGARSGNPPPASSTGQDVEATSRSRCSQSDCRQHCASAE
jgi:hypothetical protein